MNSNFSLKKNYTILNDLYFASNIYSTVFFKQRIFAKKKIAHYIHCFTGFGELSNFQIRIFFFFSNQISCRRSVIIYTTKINRPPRRYIHFRALHILKSSFKKSYKTLYCIVLVKEILE